MLHSRGLQVLRCGGVLREKQGGCGKTGFIAKTIFPPLERVVGPLQVMLHQGEEGWLN